MSDLSLRFEYELQFFAKEGEGGEKTEEPTGKKLNDARKEGQVAKSQEFASSFTLLAMFLLLRIWTSTLGRQLGELFRGFYGRIPYFTGLPAYTDNTREFSTLVTIAIERVVIIILPYLLAGFVVSFVADLVQVKWAPTSKPLKPKFSKLNPINGIKRIFSLNKLVELLKSIIKIVVMVIIIYNEIRDQWPILFALYDMPLMQAVVLAGRMLIDIGFKISLVFVVIAFADYAFQKWKFHEDMKMTKQEVKEEYKSTEGDPQIKGKIKQRMMEASRRRMMRDLPKADVVITNPTHYAVALQYDKEIAEAPFMVAKGADYMAQKIKDAAGEYGIEIVENKPLARSLYANVEIGEEIPEELYVAVAEVLAIVYRNTGRI
ncbi:MAG: flagellar biosynthesis protein FlhB [Lachnospiraceae bacterium]|nr:flagellar biosynthesis protein FlhB [Lachnospiraceae bacterium]